MRTIRLVALALLLGGAALPAEEPAPQQARVRVERKDPGKPAAPSLRWLHANRDFLRGRLDSLRQRPLPFDGQGRGLSERELFLQRILNEITAARDSVRNESALLDGSAASAKQLADLARLSDQLDLMDNLLDDQGRRLRELDALLRGEQETALIILLKGMPAGFEPDGVEIRDQDGGTWRVALDAGRRAALSRGGLVQVLHEYVEPREHRLEFRFGGSGVLAILAEAPRDRLTLLQLDLSAMASPADLTGATAKIWQD